MVTASSAAVGPLDLVIEATDYRAMSEQLERPWPSFYSGIALTMHITSSLRVYRISSRLLAMHRRCNIAVPYRQPTPIIDCVSQCKSIEATN
jgi:hypothetical protein